MGTTKQVSDATFESVVLAASGPVLVDFWAEWCGPCKMIAPALDEIGAAMAGKLTIAKLNIDDNPNTPSKYGVKAIPTLILFNNGQVVAQKLGAVPKSKLTEWIQSALPAGTTAV
jgi:thioredoxin 1